MATTIPACVALLTDGHTTAPADAGFSGRVGIRAWDVLPPVPMTATQRTAAVTAILGGTVATQADVLALIVTAAVAPVTQKQIYDLIFSGNVPTVG
jgi:hypothetical protein